MIHSFLIVGGTKKKRADVAATHASPSQFDATTLEPEEDKQTISIDQVRDLQHQLSLKPYAAKFKTGIILEAQRMTIEAQNALLKTLEEPPAHSILILTAPSTKALLPTTVSRCQVVRLPAEIDLDLKSEEHQKGVEEFLKLLGSDRGERLAWIEDNKTTISNQQLAIVHLDIWISVLRDLLLTQSNSENLTLNHKLQDRFSYFLSVAKKARFSSEARGSFILSSMKEFDKSISLHSSILLTQKTKELIASTNVSPRLALEVLLLDLPILPNPNPKG